MSAHPLSTLSLFVQCSIVIASIVSGCSDPVVDTGQGGSGGVGGTGATGGLGGFTGVIPDAGTGGATGMAGPCGATEGNRCGIICARFRDFQGFDRNTRTGHPDFETAPDLSPRVVATLGIVKEALGADRNPVFNSPGIPKMIEGGQTSFDQWYRDTPMVNESFDLPLQLTEPTPGVFVFDNQTFFPLDNMGFGNQGRIHNFHFTTEIHTVFEYRGGEKFTFQGDDDVWVFVNNKLALDLGGRHSNMRATIDFDADQAKLGISPGNMYNLDVFHAERHTTESHFRIETSIKCLRPIP